MGPPRQQSVRRDVRCIALLGITAELDIIKIPEIPICTENKICNDTHRYFHSPQS
jgi:hypothetical protein